MSAVAERASLKRGTALGSDRPDLPNRVAGANERVRVNRATLFDPSKAVWVTCARSCPDAEVEAPTRPKRSRVGSHYNVCELEGNDVAERFRRTLKENLLWVKTFETIEELRVALVEYATRYNETWLVARHGYKTPAQVRAEQTTPQLAIDNRSTKPYPWPPKQAQPDV